MDSLKFGIDAVHAAHGIAEGTICYTGDILNPQRSDKVGQLPKGAAWEVSHHIWTGKQPLIAPAHACSNVVLICAGGVLCWHASQVRWLMAAVHIQTADAPAVQHDASCTMVIAAGRVLQDARRVHCQGLQVSCNAQSCSTLSVQANSL